MIHNSNYHPKQEPLPQCALYIQQDGTGHVLHIEGECSAHQPNTEEKPKAPTEKTVMEQIKKQTPKVWYQKTWKELFFFWKY